MSKADRRFAREQLARSREDHQRWLDERWNKAAQECVCGEPESPGVVHRQDGPCCTEGSVVEVPIDQRNGQWARAAMASYLPLPRVTAEDIYDAVDIVRTGGRRARARARVMGYQMRPGERESYPPGDQGTTVSWTHTMPDTGVSTVTVYQRGDGTMMVLVDGVYGPEPAYTDPRLEPVDIIDRIDKVLADDEHPEHIDALVNYQIDKYRHNPER
jgi:hypothetical protein